jgi:hypothetical protein
MAMLYPASDGTILRALLNATSVSLFPTPPIGAGPAFVFDHTTNPDLVTRLRDTPGAFRLVDGGLMEHDQPVTVAPAAAQQRAVDPAAIGAALDALPADQPLTKADLAPLLALFGAGAGQA